MRQQIAEYEAVEVERRLTEQALKESESRNRALLEAVPNAIFTSTGTAHT